MTTTAIFDLDGVLVDSAKYHYLAWRRLAHTLGFDFKVEDSHATKGVNRLASLEIVLSIGGVQDQFTNDEKLAMAEQKNKWYLEYINQIDETELLPNVRELLEDLREHSIKIALGSASKNARLILRNCKIESLFDVVVDGNMVHRAKPDPEVFLVAASLAGSPAASCVVFEDAQAGVEAALSAGMKCVGICLDGPLPRATIERDNLVGFTYDDLIKLM